VALPPPPPPSPPHSIESRGQKAQNRSLDFGEGSILLLEVFLGLADGGDLVSKRSIMKGVQAVLTREPQLEVAYRLLAKELPEAAPNSNPNLNPNPNPHPNPSPHPSPHPNPHPNLKP